MRLALASLVTLLVLAGCGDSNPDDSGPNDTSASEVETAASESDTAASEQSPKITVSSKTTCDQLFGGDGKGPLEAVVDWWSNDEGMTLKLNKQLEEVAQSRRQPGADCGLTC